MSDSNDVTRRTVLQMTAAAAGAVMASSCGAESKRSDTMTSKNADFYGADSAFDPVKAKNAYIAMMERFNYPIPDVLKGDDLWVCDFLQGNYSKLGMAGVFWTNAKGVYGETGEGAYKGPYKESSYGYLGHEIYLLPGQMLPEHRHIGGTEGYGPKMEAWHVRYGDVQFFGEHKGAGDETPISDMPAAEQPWGFGEDWFKSKYVAKRTAQSGKLYSLEDPETWHFQRAGANGAIVSEYATYHNHVEFSKPGMEFDNTKAKEA
ncbi:MAG: hypothetical protein QGH15_17450 [Kiritimatiellia bacterium]|nr:hypothetical protein [Kiritimatiellia bacterium]